MSRRQTIQAALLTVLTVVLAGSAASAQTWPCPSPGSIYSVFNGSWGGVPAPYYGGYPHYRGSAPVYQPRACRTRYCETANDVEQYFKRKLTNIEYRYKMKPALIRARLERDTEIIKLKEQYAETIENNRRRAEALARQAAPGKLTESEYDPIAGVVHWPWLVKEDHRFAEDRQRVEALLAQASGYHVRPGSASRAEAVQAIEQMKTTLLAMLDRREVNGTTYAATKSFLRRLAYQVECGGAPSDTRLAAN